MKKKKRKKTKGIERIIYRTYAIPVEPANISSLPWFHYFNPKVSRQNIRGWRENLSSLSEERERDSDVESRVVVSDKRTLQFSILKIHPSPCNIPVRLACHGNHPRLNNRSSCACILTHFDLFVRRLIRPPTTANYNSWTRISRCGD